ncbi:MAG: Asp-tRNA(Asn)/Glu-tRNA(Gln) amidotransferase subunit GatB [Candidatus Paceibacterota bacterium]
MTTYFPTIGLEIHAELDTVTKMFCSSKNDPDAEPNTNICPICMAHPGTLPTINKEAVKHVLRVGHAVGGTIADFTEFDRKNYFYPDIPKGYQISQYEHPLVSGGSLGGVALTRVHLEEDTAKSTHNSTKLMAGDQGSYSLVDFNRSGVPLMELVTEPVITSGEEAATFAKELQLLLRYLGAGEANMEKGQMRVEANISVSTDKDTFGTKVEVKNLNSFRSVEGAIACELARHTKLLEEGKGGEIVQETRGWDEQKQTTFSQRQKEGSADYRYFPDPDLPKLWISKIPEFQSDELSKEIPELPWERRERYAATYSLDEQTSDIFVRSLPWAAYFEAVMAEIGQDPDRRKLAVNYITTDLIGMMKKDDAIEFFADVDPADYVTPAGFAATITMTAESALSSRGAKDLLATLYREEAGADPKTIAEREGLLQTSDEGAIKSIVAEVVAENPEETELFKQGNEKVLQFLVGQGMKKSKGSANPQVLKELFEKELK